MSKLFLAGLRTHKWVKPCSAPSHVMNTVAVMQNFYLFTVAGAVSG